MKKKNLQRGSLSLVVVIIVALVIVIGGGVYLSKHNAKVATDTNTSLQTGADVSTSGKNGTIRDLLALGGNATCTFNQTSDSGKMSGTVYISGNMMRGDFIMTSQSNTSMDSHMIRNGDVMYAWTGNQGAKMNFAGMATTSTQTDQQVNLDQKVDYDCGAWSPDSSKFTVPTTVNFMDISANMNAGANAGASAQCGACASLDGSAKTQCLAALHC